MKYVIHKLQSRYYRKQEYVTLRLRVPKDEEKEKGPIVAEQIFASLYGAFHRTKWHRFLRGHTQDKMSFEIANINNRVHFYVHVPKKLKQMVESQFYAQYPEVEIEEVTDYIHPPKTDIASPENSSSNLSSESQALTVHQTDLDKKKEEEKFTPVDPLQNMIVAEMKTYGLLLWPFKTYDFFASQGSKEDRTLIDTLSSITTAMSKLNNKGDQAWLQVVVRPQHYYWQRYGWKCYYFFLSGYFGSPYWFGKWFTSWYVVSNRPYHWIIQPLIWVGKVVWRAIGKYKPVENISIQESKETGFSFWEVPKKKLQKIGFQTNVRLAYLPSDGNIQGGYLKLKEVAAGFNQFQIPYVNGLGVARMGQSKELIRRYKERDFYKPYILSVDELATIYHLPLSSNETPNIVWVSSRKLEPPTDLPRPSKHKDPITILGETSFRGERELFGIKQADRRRHIYIIGKTGMGKSVFLENMIHSDILNGKGVAVIDPHGDLADHIIDFIPPHRTNDVIIFDPSDRDYPVSFNMLESVDPAHHSLISSGLVGVFKKLYADSWGPRLEHILRNTILALLEYPNTTMLGILRMLVDDKFRQKVVDNVTDPVVKSFWVSEFARMQDRLRVEAVSPIQNKVGQFLSSPIIRNILGQPKSSIDIRYIMDNKKILIVNLSKGKIGEDSSSLLGSMIITKIQLDAMSRADIPEDKREDFYLYVDEFQNFATEAFATILSEARKYRLNLTVANQYIAQMPDEVRDAVFGNVGSLITFQVGYDDAEYFSKQFSEEVMPNDIISLDKYTTYTKILIDNVPTRTFSTCTLPPPQAEPEPGRREKVIRFSRERFSKRREVVEDKIKRWSEAASAAIAESAKKLPGAKKEDTFRNEQNQEEFEKVLKSSTLPFKLISREDYEKYGIPKATNEYIYFLKEDVLVYSTIDPQGNCFRKKASEAISFYELDLKTKETKPTGKKVYRTENWQRHLAEALKQLGGTVPENLKSSKKTGTPPTPEDMSFLRNEQNQEEFEKVLKESNLPFKLIDKKEHEKYNIPKSINEHVYLLKDNILVHSTLDPQGNCFRRGVTDAITFQLFNPKKKENEVLDKKVLRSLDWQ
ncbi:MAG TPA: DUF87 domain-containing protein, partial [Candidatus Peregrinibacteria bacterium]|nr:DUF87 domain-containing protein [Candidatus Peregrinibacteria bacterium]